jgi:SAM-dependent methyltransferase
MDGGWDSAVHTEIAFWRRQMCNILENKEPNLGWRLCSRELEARYMNMIREDRRDTARILDVGSGPFTHLGGLWNGKPIDLTCVDPLALAYRDLCAEHKIKPPITAVSCHAEALTSLFAPNSFDLVTSTNALDHAHRPEICVEQMFAVCRPGGSVFIEVVENVGEHEKYFGLHQHNFTIADEALILWRPDGFRVNLNEMLADQIAGFIPDRAHPWAKFDWGDGFISAHFIKRETPITA